MKFFLILVYFGSLGAMDHFPELPRLMGDENLIRLHHEIINWQSLPSFFRYAHQTMDCYDLTPGIAKIQYDMIAWFLKQPVVCGLPLGAFIDSRDPVDPLLTTFLHKAVRHNSCPLVELILGYNPAVNMVDSMCRAPLHYAMEGGYISIIELLLRHGASTHLKDNFHKTPLDYATFDDESAIGRLIREFSCGQELDVATTDLGQLEIS